MPADSAELRSFLKTEAMMELTRGTRGALGAGEGVPSQDQTSGLAPGGLGGASGRVLTSDHGLVYHLKQGRSKHMLSSAGFVASPHSGSLRVCSFPLVSSMHRTSLFFTPRPQVVLH